MHQTTRRTLSPSHMGPDPCEDIHGIEGSEERSTVPVVYFCLLFIFEGVAVFLVLSVFFYSVFCVFVHFGV